MAMFDDIFAGSSGLASTLLKTMGISGSYVKHTSTYDPRTDVTTKSDTTTSVTISPPLNYNAYEIATLGVKKEDCKIIGLGTNFNNVEDTVDQIVANGKTYTIMSHKDVLSGNQLAIVIMQCRLQAS